MPSYHKVVSGVVPFGKAFMKIARGEKFGFSFNLADRCPVGCNCYWRAMNRVPELDDDSVVEFFEAQKREGKVHVTIVGGEPYVRPGLLKRVTPIMPGNWVVTSGTTPLLVLPQTTHFISIDGMDSATHDRVRRMPGLYDRILKNLATIRKTGEFPAFIHTVLNAVNFRQAESILRTWMDNGLADGVIFSTITPISGGNDAELQLDHGKQKAVIEELLMLKKRYGDFLCMTKEMIEMFDPDLMAERTPANCGTAKFVDSFDASGKSIPQCILSDKADCSRCGCVITTMVETFTRFPPSLGTLKLLTRFYTP
jgi:sulfatase maturation enzyme AslB (radical SAM superfamily)